MLDGHEVCGAGWSGRKVGKVRLHFLLRLVVVHIWDVPVHVSQKCLSCGGCELTPEAEHCCRMYGSLYQNCRCYQSGLVRLVVKAALQKCFGQRVELAVPAARLVVLSRPDGNQDLCWVVPRVRVDFQVCRCLDLRLGRLSRRCLRRVEFVSEFQVLFRPCHFCRYQRCSLFCSGFGAVLFIIRARGIAVTVIVAVVFDLNRSFR